MTERIETAELERLALVLDRGFGNPTFKERHDAATALRELIAIRAHTAAQPAPDAVADAAIADDDSLAKRISELGWQIHNLGCEYQNDEKLLDRLQDLRGMAWEIADTVREGAA